MSEEQVYALHTNDGTPSLEQIAAQEDISESPTEEMSPSYGMLFTYTKQIRTETQVFLGLFDQFQQEMKGDNKTVIADLRTELLDRKDRILQYCQTLQREDSGLITPLTRMFAHDIRNAAGSLIGIYFMDSAEDSEQREISSDIFQSSGTILQLCDHVSSLSAKRDFTLLELMQRAATTYGTEHVSVQAEENLRAEMPEGVPADLYIAIHTAIENAGKACKIAKVRPDITISLQRDTREDIQGYAIQITDKGSGVDPVALLQSYLTKYKIIRLTDTEVEEAHRDFSSKGYDPLIPSILEIMTSNASGFERESRGNGIAMQQVQEIVRSYGGQLDVQSQAVVSGDVWAYDSRDPESIMGRYLGSTFGERRTGTTISFFIPDIKQLTATKPYGSERLLAAR